MRTALGAVEERFERRQPDGAGTPGRAEAAEVPAQLGAPDRAVAFGSGKRRFQDASVDRWDDVEERAGSAGQRHPAALVHVGGVVRILLCISEARSFVLLPKFDLQRWADAVREHKPRAVLNFAAESHVDRSILGPGEFIETNVVGTYRLLECAREYFNGLGGDEKNAFRFLHVSTDEVYGTLAAGDAPFSEANRYEPNSPYAASKAASDHLVRAWHHTYGLPVVTSNCSNNYGPYQFPEKLIPLMILSALQGKPLPVYGKGENVRDWLYVEDHAVALLLVLLRGRTGETYNIGGDAEAKNIDIVRAVCRLLDARRPADAPHDRGIERFDHRHVDTERPRRRGHWYAKYSTTQSSCHQEWRERAVISRLLPLTVSYF